MNFFEHQQRARHRTWLLALLFVLATIATLALTNGVALALVASFSKDFYYKSTSLSAWISAHPSAFWWTSLGTLGAIGAASMYRMASLSTGGGAVARALGGMYLDSEVAEPNKRQLRNVVEEMAIAAGIPVPQLYVLEQESGINAFAAGFTTSDAAVTVTQGALDFLTRDELQGVVAHEFSHILNGDMRLNTRLLGVIYGLLFVGFSGRIILRGLGSVRGPSRRGGGQAVVPILFCSVALIVIGYVGMFFGALIRAAVSRQREFLADASAVQFTRNPQGIAGALKKIAASPLRAVFQMVDPEEISHMLIADGRKMFTRSFATHPPILQRIKAIDPGFEPAELQQIRLRFTQTESVSTQASRVTHAIASPATILASIGQLSPMHAETASHRTAAIPENLLRVARSHVHASSLVVALALNRDPAERARQIATLNDRLPETMLPHLEAVAALVAALPAEQRLPLAQIAFPALRQLGSVKLQALVRTIEEITRMDGRFDVMDYALVRVLRLQLAEAAAPQSAPVRVTAKLSARREEIGVLIAVVAHVGDRDKNAAGNAYEAGIRPLLGSWAPAYILPDPWIAPLDRALTRLDRLAPFAKQSLIEALIVTITHDKRVKLGELELFRAICASLHCPVPALEVTSMPAAERVGSRDAVA